LGGGESDGKYIPSETPKRYQKMGAEKGGQKKVFMFPR